MCKQHGAFEPNGALGSVMNHRTIKSLCLAGALSCAAIAVAWISDASAPSTQHSVVVAVTPAIERH